MRTLSSRQWLGLAWAAYALLPGLVLLLVLWGIALVSPGQSATHMLNAHPALVITLPALTQLSVPVVAVIFVGWAALKPLRAMNAAAAKVGKHDLEFTLPSSPVREVNEALRAFTAMGAELRAALARQEELEQERRFYISAISHDLNSPIFALRGYLEGLESGVAATPERAQRYLEICQAKVSELEHLTADLSAYTEVERLEQTMRHEPFALDALVCDAVDSVRPQAEAKGMALTLTQGAPICPCVGDARLLQRALTNLLENAVRYTREGGAVSVAVCAEGERWRVSVSDSGPGIAPADLERLFAPFYRGEASRNRATGGAGLGLAIAQRILLAHGGALTVANNPQGGAVFEASAPITVPSAALA